MDEPKRLLKRDNASFDDPRGVSDTITDLLGTKIEKKEKRRLIYFEKKFFYRKL